MFRDIIKLMKGGTLMEMPVQAQLIKKIYDNSYGDLKSKYDLTMNEIMFLLYLDKNQNKNIASEIVEELMTTKSHISKSVDSLSRKKIIVRIQDDTDRKIMRLYINTTADIILKELKEREKQIRKNITKGISTEDLNTFNKVLEQMKENFNKMAF